MSDPLTTVATSSRTYTVTGREVRTDAALLVVPLVRAATGRPLPARSPQPQARTRHPHARVRIASGALLVVAGRPDLALRPAPAATTIPVELSMPGEPPFARDFVIPAGSALPLTLPAWELDDPLRTVTGTVRRKAFPFPSVPQATVVSGPGTAGPPFLLALRTPLALDHPAGRTVQACTLTAGAATVLASATTGGATSLFLASTAGISAGTVLAFGPDTIAEQVVAAGTGPGTGEVLLRTLVVHSAEAGTPVSTFTAAVAGLAAMLAVPARAGEGVLQLDALPAAVASASAVRLEDANRSEVRTPHIVTDADGHFRLAGVGNLATIALTATGPSGTGAAVTTALDPRGGPVDVDLAVP